MLMLSEIANGNNAFVREIIITNPDNNRLIISSDEISVHNMFGKSYMKGKNTMILACPGEDEEHIEDYLERERITPVELFQRAKKAEIMLDFTQLDKDRPVPEPMRILSLYIKKDELEENDFNWISQNLLLALSYGEVRIAD